MFFADLCQKFDRNFKSVGREVLVTENNLFIMGSEKAKEGPNKGKFVKIVKRKVPFNQLQSISMRYFLNPNYLILVQKQMICL